MEEYIRLEEEKARRHGKVYNCYVWYDLDNEDVYDFGSVETEFSSIVFNDMLTSEAPLSYEPTVSSLNNDEFDLRISFDESDDEDYTIADTAYPNPWLRRIDYLHVIQSLFSARSIRRIH
nr:hypothetical protein [Tanacetum cinerariifolium]